MNNSIKLSSVKYFIGEAYQVMKVPYNKKSPPSKEMSSVKELIKLD